MSVYPARAEGGVLVAHPPRITDSKNVPIRVLHKGFDGFDIAFMGALRSEDIAALEAARERAEKEFAPTLVEIGPGRVPFHVAAHGIKGGYRYACDTGFLGEKWFFSQNQDPRRWNIRVSAKSLPLAVYGIERGYRRLRDTLQALGVSACGESIGRVDYAVDFQMDGAFRLQPEQFVVHSRSGIAEYDASLAEERLSPDDIRIYFVGRRASSVTIGKQPGRQVIVYDKRREIVAKHKFYWFDLWGQNESDSLTVFRVEFRAGKKHLEHWQIKRFDDLRAQVGDMFIHAAKAVRYVASESDGRNISRRSTHPLWAAVQRELDGDLLAHLSGIVPGRVINGERERILQQYMDQIAALVPGALIASGYEEGEAEGKVAALFAKIEQYIAFAPLKFQERCTRARERLHFSLAES